MFTLATPNHTAVKKLSTTQGETLTFSYDLTPRAFSNQKLVKFCQVLQSLSPINSHITPIPAKPPGYADEVVMAGGTFIDGSTLELSADGPLRPPYAVFLQGGLTYAHTRLALQKILERLEH